MDTQTGLDFDDIQGIILHGYKRLRFTRYLFVHFQVEVDPEEAKRLGPEEVRKLVDGRRARVRRWLLGLLKQVTPATARPKSDRRLPALNLGFTAPGLSAIGFEDAEMVTFPTPFHQGMVNEYRQRILGDVGENDPKGWSFGNKKGPEEIHAILILNAATKEEVENRLAELKRVMPQSHVAAVHEESGLRREDDKEHFGFVDGVSQPAVEGSGREATDGEPAIKAGEFLLGHLNEYLEMPDSPSVPAGFDPDGNLFTDPVSSGRRDLGKNGSYLVFRKLEQHVDRFVEFTRESVKKPDGSIDAAEALHMAARIMGRWQSGTSLVVSPDRDSGDTRNDFGYHTPDPKGMRCPIGAHVRRANPRDALPDDPADSKKETRRHRLIRRGRIYGEEDTSEERGFQFIAINASISRQFEFVHQTWINSPKFDDLYGDPDPLVGVDPYQKEEEAQKEGEGRETFRGFTVQREPVRCRFTNLPHFVQVRGGGYFFLPSIRALRYIAAGDYAGPNRPDVGFTLAVT